MKRNIGPVGWTRVMSWLGVCLLAGIQVPCGWGEEVSNADQVAVLRMLSARSKKTWDGLKTWRGTLQSEGVNSCSGDRAKRYLDLLVELRGAEFETRPAEFKGMVRTRATFAVDFEHDNLFSRTELESRQYVDSATGATFNIATPTDQRRRGQPFLDETPYRHTSIVTAEHLLRVEEPNVPYRDAPDGGAGLRIGYRAPLAKTAFHEVGTIVRTFEVVYYVDGEKTGQTGILDPRAYLSIARPTWLELEMIAAQVEKTGWPEACGVSFQVRKEGSGAQEEYRIVRPGQSGSGRCIVEEITFRADADFNITLFVEREPGGPVHREKRWQYKEQEGLWLPYVVQTQTFDRRDGSLTDQSTQTFVESEINRPIALETFTERNLGLQEGDRLQDKLTGQVCVYAGGTLKPVEDANTDAASPPVVSPK